MLRAAATSAAACAASRVRAACRVPLLRAAAHGAAPTTCAELRAAFQEYFASRGHRVLPGSGVIPQDRTLLFTSAGMVQFKDVILGRASLPFSRATTVQRCVRAGGKHNDIENVGVTRRHHTYFEMLGNFSFGDYFKHEATAMAWELLTTVLRLPRERLHVTYLEGDEDTRAVWRALGLADENVRPGPPEDNFWSMGSTGPCGPCTEIYYDLGEHVHDSSRFLEIWNVVLMDSILERDGAVSPSAFRCVDTGMGLERLAAVLQHREHNFATDELRAAVLAVRQHVSAVVEHADARAQWLPPSADALDAALDEWRLDERSVAARVVADHARCVLALVHEGVQAGATGRGYVLRKMLRRMFRALATAGCDARALDWAAVLPDVLHSQVSAYPEYASSVGAVSRVVAAECNAFAAMIDRCQKALRRHAGGSGGGELRVRDAFQLVTSVGFPLDMLQAECARAGATCDWAELGRALGAERERSRQSWSGASETLAVPVGVVDQWATHALAQPAQATAVQQRIEHAVGRDVDVSVPVDASVLFCDVDGEHAFVALSPSPFYARGGGQTGDRGWLVLPGGDRVPVVDTLPAGEFAAAVVPAAALLGEGVLEQLGAGARVQAQLDAEHRASVTRHHSATHLLNAALRSVLGAHVTQAGSWVGSDRLRFDFTHERAPSAGELEAVEQWVTDAIVANAPVDTETLSLADAVRGGALATFGEKYGERVRVVRMGALSAELCGGTHVGHTGELCAFRLTSSGAVAAGTRRLEAISGPRALRRLLDADRAVSAAWAALGAARATGSSAGDPAPSAAALGRRVQELQEQLHAAQQQLGRAYLRPGLELLADGRRGERARVRVYGMGAAGDVDEKVLAAALRAEIQERARAEPAAVTVLLVGDRIALTTGDSGVDARALLAELTGAVGGRGGGDARTAQGRLAADTDDARARAAAWLARV
jgi:alanyl-tRNA synthetase